MLLHMNTDVKYMASMLTIIAVLLLLTAILIDLAIKYNLNTYMVLSIDCAIAIVFFIVSIILLLIVLKKEENKEMAS